MSKLYVKATSDSGKGVKTRGGHKVLQARFTADTKGGRSEVIVRLEVHPNGDVTMETTPIKVCPGFHILGRSRLKVAS